MQAQIYIFLSLHHFAVDYKVTLDLHRFFELLQRHFYMETTISKMETPMSYEMRIILLLLKDFSTMHTITSIGKNL